jgi:hypothetical protein
VPILRLLQGSGEHREFNKDRPTRRDRAPWKSIKGPGMVPTTTTDFTHFLPQFGRACSQYTPDFPGAWGGSPSFLLS